MFTGVVIATGSIHSSTPTDKGARIEIASGGLDMTDVHVGDSIAVDGCCLTVIEKTARGFLSASQVREAIRPSNIHVPPTGLVCLENTHNRHGGTCCTQEEIDAVADVAHAAGVRVHLDGARLFNAAVALDRRACEFTRHVDSVTFCLSKGLAAPVGSVVCGSPDLIVRARRIRKMLGGGMRQAGILAAAGLVALSSVLPLWSMTMRAPQYPKGLRLNAYGTAITGDLRELNILNHYIGMPPIEAPAFETAMFPVAVALVVVLCLLAPLHRWLWRVAGAVALVMPIAVLADLQWRLYTFGHSLDPHAPIRLAPFTPLVVGTTHMGNFVSTAMPSYGTFCLLAAALVLTFASRCTGHGQLVPRTALRRAAVVLITTGLALKTLPVAAHRSSAVPSGSSSLAARIAAAAPGATIVVDGGTHSGPLTIRGPLTLIGTNGATIDGGGITAPSLAFYDLNGRWAIENEGVAPDVEVEITPADIVAGRDPQLERAVQEALKLLEQSPVKRVPRPAPIDRVSPARRPPPW